MFAQNRKNYLNQIKDASLAVFLSGHSHTKSADQHFGFEVNRNFYYLTGINQENVILVIVKGANKEESFLFLEKQDPIKALWDGEVLTFEEAAKISGVLLPNVKDIADYDSFISGILGFSRRALFGVISNLYFDLDKPLISTIKPINYIECDRFRSNYPTLAINNSYPIVAESRKIKSDYEIKKTKEAIKITKEALERVLTNIKPGLYEYQIEAEYNYVLQYNNKTTSFNTICASGENATILHYEDNDSKIKDNELVLFDLGVKNDVYCSDISRTYPANGKFTQRQKDVYEVVLNANKETIKWLKPGVSYLEFNEYGRDLLIKGLKKLGLITKDEDYIKYYYHSLGHNLGLDVHDVGDTTKLIEEGVLITVEPGLYIKEWGIGIRIEDNILITKDGCINLSKDIIKEVKDIETFMSENNN